MGADDNQAGDTLASLSWQLWIDGTALPNPGRISLGLVLLSPDGNSQQREQLLDQRGCNNEAELRALLAGLAWAWEVGARSLTIFSDSDFVVRHVRGEQSTQIAHLAALIAKAQSALAHIPAHQLNWIPRHKNSQADALARSAQGLSPKLSAPKHQRNQRRQGRRKRS